MGHVTDVGHVTVTVTAGSHSLLPQAGQYAEAEPLIVKCLELCIKMVGEKHAHVASCHNNIAGLLRNQGKLAQAEPHQRQALKISEEIAGNSGKTAT